jgi:hypothetical protein
MMLMVLRQFLFLFMTLPVTFFLGRVNLDIVRTEAANDTPDVELMETDLLLTPTVVFGFSLNDKIWCTFLILSLSKSIPLC